MRLLLCLALLCSPAICCGQQKSELGKTWLEKQTLRCNRLLLEKLNVESGNIACVVGYYDFYAKSVGGHFAGDNQVIYAIQVSGFVMSNFDDNLVAAVLAHELAHIVYYEKRRRFFRGFLSALAFRNTHIKNEKRADKMGVVMLKRAGIPPENLIFALERILNNNPKCKECGERIAALKKLLNRTRHRPVYR